MPFAPKIRKDILQALENHILPALQSQTIIQLLAAPPFDFSAVKHWTIQEELLPDNDKGHLQVIREWPEHRLVATRGFHISFLYEGFMHKKVGALESHGEMMRKRKIKRPPGVQVLKLSAPLSLLFADFTAKEDRADHPEMLHDRSRTLSLHLDRDGSYVFHSMRAENQHTGSHHLEINDTSLSQLGAMYFEEMRQNSNPACAQTLLLAIMYRLQYYLQYKKPGISNSCWLDPEDEFERPLSKIEMKHQTLCADVIDYAQNHLHRPLSLKMIADQFEISAFHLNTIFREVHGITLMRYVTDLRINVAKRILLGNRERISDVAGLTGFASANSFSHVFRKSTGLSPSQFRRKNARNGH